MNDRTLLAQETVESWTDEQRTAFLWFVTGYSPEAVEAYAASLRRCGESLHKSCNCVRPANHEGMHNCSYTGSG